MYPFALPTDAGRYSDRIRSPRATVEAVRPHFAKLGISRVARQTGLDRIGIPCFAAIRPNAASLATNQGKGADDDSARASAVMEATEFALAEQPHAAVQVASERELRSRGHRVHRPNRLLPLGEPWDEDREIPWIGGYELETGEPVEVPLDVVTIGANVPVSLPVARSTNGLASGNCRDEAVFHALTELIERDAATLWSLKGPADIASRRTDPSSLGDPVVDLLQRRIRGAGLELSLFDQTTDVGVPVFSAHIFERQKASPLYFDQSEGCGCHPVPARAAIRAITEAAQTRITNISGARDDFSPTHYRRTLGEGAGLYRVDESSPDAEPPRGCPLGTPLPTLNAFVRQSLALCDVDEIVVVPLGGEEFDVSVVKVLAPRLEDRAPNGNWHPGPRVLRQLRVA